MGMAKSGDEVTSGSPDCLPDSGGDDADPMLAFAQHLGRRLLTLQGKLTPHASIQMALFEDEDRAKIIEDFIASLTPSSVSPAVWMRWLNGGPGPFASGAIKMPEKMQHGMGKSLTRGPASIKTSRAKVERAREELAQAERELEFTEGRNKALLQYAVTDHLIEVLSGIFAMGPGWTVMRALSAHLSDAEAEFETFDLIGKEKDRAIEAMRAARVRETSMMMEVLDLGSGNVKFEAALRMALKNCCAVWDKKRDILLADGRKPRSSGKVKNEAHPKAQDDAEQVLQGLKQAG